MHFNDLPDDVLDAVLQAAVLPLGNCVKDAKAGKALLSVCRRWRDTVLPAVYGTIIVKCHPKAGPGAECATITTKLGQVASAKWQYMARKVIIDVRYRDAPLSACKAVIAKLHELADEWARVRKLEFSLSPERYTFGDGGPPASHHADEIAGITSGLSALMPGLREIGVDFANQTLVTQALCGQLVSLYADQLEVLNSRQLLVVPNGPVYTRLRNVSITNYSSFSQGVQLPRFDPEVVERLVLDGFRSNDVWPMFCADGEGCAITFPRLRYLWASFDRGMGAPTAELSGERPWALQFPALKHMHLQCTEHECRSMERAVFPATMEVLICTAPDTLYQALAAAQLHVTRRLDLHTWLLYDEDASKVAAANSILKAADSCEFKCLSIAHTARFPPELVTYKRLTELVWSVSASVEDMMAHIHSQPHLEILTVDSLVLTNVQTDFSIPSSAERELVAPLDTQISKLTIGVDEESEAPELEILMVKYLLLKIPTLAYVQVSEHLLQPIYTFVDRYVQQYPHLANVEFQFGRKRHRSGC